MDTEVQFVPPEASTAASQVDALYYFLWSISGFFTILIFALVVYFGLKYRRRNLVPPPEVPTSYKLEALYTFIPFVVVMIIFFWSAQIYFFMFRAPVDSLDVYVIGKQWMWKVQHPTGRREINELHVPRGRPVTLTIASQDVIHSFYIPAFRVKMDAVPGRYTKVWFEATKTGVYHLFCAEYCGTDHSGMIGKVIVMEPEEYQAWLTGAAADVPPAQAGAELFKSLGCATCHGSVAPSMAGLYGKQVQLASGETVIADEQYLRRSILNSTAQIVAGYAPIMPSYQNQISEDQLMQLVAYIKSLSNPQTIEKARQ